jgi:hypothetical protein
MLSLTHVRVATCVGPWHGTEENFAVRYRKEQRREEKVEPAQGGCEEVTEDISGC